MKTCNFTRNSCSDGATSGDVNMWWCTDYNTGCIVLDSLKFADQGLRETSRERITMVKAWKYRRNNKSFGGMISKVLNLTWGNHQAG